MTLDTDLWAIVTPAGKVAGDGECPCLLSSEGEAEREIASNREWLESMNGPGLRVAKVRLAEVS